MSLSCPPLSGWRPSIKTTLSTGYIAGIAWLARNAHWLLGLTQVGRIRRYAVGIALGAVVITGMVVLL